MFPHHISTSLRRHGCVLNPGNRICFALGSSPSTQTITCSNRHQKSYASSLIVSRRQTKRQTKVTQKSNRKPSRPTIACSILPWPMDATRASWDIVRRGRPIATGKTPRVALTGFPAFCWMLMLMLRILMMLRRVLSALPANSRSYRKFRFTPIPVFREATIGRVEFWEH